MYRWINSEGGIIRTKTVKEFARKFDFSYSMAKSLACGYRARLKGFCSTSPKAKKHRERFTTVLVNTRTGERSILGPNVKKFANDHGLSLQGTSELINGRVQMYRHWALERTLEMVNVYTPDTHL